MNQHIDEESIKQPNLRDIIRVYKVGAISFGGGLNSDIKSTISAYVTYKDREQA